MTKTERGMLRSAARARGDKTYTTGQPCARGHDGERFVSNYSCIACMSENSITWARKNHARLKGGMVAWRLKNRPRVSASHRQWLSENRPSTVIHKANRRARKTASPGRLSKGIAEKLLALQRGRCAGCRSLLNSKFHLDHKEPLAGGGTNVDSNMQLLCVPCNLSKHARDPIEFMQSRGFLL